MVTLGRHVMQQPDEDNVENQHQNSCYEDDDVSIKTESSSSSEENHDKNDDGLTTDCVAIASSSSNPDCISPPPIPTYGAVNVQNSNDVFIGNKTYYQGPVTIKQVLYRNQNNENHFIEHGEVKRITESGDIDDGYRSGCDNLSFNDDRSEFEQKKNNGLNGFPSGLPNQSQLSNQGTDLFLKIYIRYKLLIYCVILAIISCILLTVLLTIDDSANLNQIYNEDIDVPIPDNNVTLPDNGLLKIKSRVEWNARPAVNASTPLVLPLPLVIIHHTATDNCSTQAGCNLICVRVQDFHMDSNGWWDIGYNFLVGGDGFVYEGRGWYGQGAHLYGYNNRSIGIAFIGTFIKLQPPKRQIKAAQQLINLGVEKGVLREDYKILAALQLSQTLSPGITLFNEMKTWPHWSENP